MISSREYLGAVRDVLAALGQPPECAPSTLLDGWQSFIEDCEEGYHWDVSEYDNDIRVRRVLEALLRDRALIKFPELAEVARRVANLDERFRQLLQADVERPGRDYWWEQGVLRFSGPPYAEYFRKAYGIEVELVE